MQAFKTSTRGLASIGRFAAHVLEMCMAMCLACPVMVAVMLLRAGVYSQTHTAHRSTAHLN